VSTTAAMRLIRVTSSHPFELKRNHQVLAYGYDLVGTALTLHLYDPNRPRDDHVTLSLSLANPWRTNVLVFPAGPTVHAFFHVPYARDFNLSTVPPDPSRRPEPVVIPDGAEPKGAGSGR
jgi:hypothetical protein